jgi:hypothetical protein
LSATGSENDDGFHGLLPYVNQYCLSELTSSVVGNRCLKCIIQSDIL